MESRVEQAVERHRQGYNCAQAVVCTYCDLFGLDEQTAYRLSEAFGAGMGMQSVCGALTGALMLLGLEKGGGLDQVGATKSESYQRARMFEEAFIAHVGSVICKDIKTPPVQCSCGGCVEHAAQIVEKQLL